MLYTKKIDLFLKGLLVFAISLFSFPRHLYATNLPELVDGVSVNENSFCTETDCFFPEKIPTDSDICIEDPIRWSKDKNLVLHTQKNIIFKKGGKIINKGSGSIILKSGMMPGEKDVYDSTVKFEGKRTDYIETGGKVKIYYNPIKGMEKYKYHNPTIYSDILPRVKLETYMLVNDVYDLQDITTCLYGAYALSQDIDASPTKERNWGSGKGFFPIKNAKNGAPFSGIFDGNNHIIKNLYINRPEEDMVGLFGDVTGVNKYRSILKDFTVKDSFILGRKCVGVIIGQATGVEISNVNVINSDINSNTDDLGELGGCVLVNTHSLISANNTRVYIKGELQKEAKLFGSCVHCKEDVGSNKKEAEKKDEK